MRWQGRHLESWLSRLTIRQWRNGIVDHRIEAVRLESTDEVTFNRAIQKCSNATISSPWCSVAQSNSQPTPVSLPHSRTLLSAGAMVLDY